MSRTDAWRRLGVTEQTVIYWEKRGYLRRTERNRQVFYPVADIVAQAMKNPRLINAALRLEAEHVGSNGGRPEAAPSASSVVELQSTLALRDAEIALLRERIAADEREIDRLHATLQRLADR